MLRLAPTTLPVSWRVHAESVPRLLPGFAFKKALLTAFELRICELIDGKRNVGEIAEAASLAEPEVEAILRTFQDLQVADLRKGFDAPAPEPAAGPPPLPKAPEPPTEPIGLDAGPTDRFMPRPPAGVVPLPGRTTDPDIPRSAPAADNALRRERAEQISRMARDLEQQGDIQRAIDTLRMGIAVLKTDGNLYNQLAILIAYRRKAFAEAEALLRQALRLDPANRDSERNLDRVLTMAAARVQHERRIAKQSA